MVKANGMIVIPEGKEGIEAGEEADVILFKPVQEA
jgi:molybdopterin biosynthesis enzyme